MKVKVDRAAVQRARHINTIVMVDGEWRTYYLMPTPKALDMLIVLRNNLVLEEVAGRIVDARVGWDIVHHGYGSDEDIGKKRSKVTIYKTMTRLTYESTLSQVSEYQEAS